MEKALALSGKSLKGKEVKVERHRKSPLYVKPVKESKGTQKASPKKMKGENGAAVPVKEEQSDEDEDDEDMSDDSEGDLLAAFQGKMQKLKSVKKEDDDEDDDDEDEDDSEDGEGEDDDEEEDEDDEEDDEEDDDDDEEDDE